MAEIIGLTSSILAIAGAADAALRMAKSMRHLSRDLRAAKKDIRHFARDIDDFSSIIDAAHFCLKSHSTESQSQTKVLVFIHERKLLDQLVDQSDRVIAHIEELRPGLKSLRSNISVVERFKWLMRRAEVRSLGPKMESVKTSLNLVINLVTYEALMQSVRHQTSSRHTSKMTLRRMKRLEHHMKCLMERMTEFQEQQQRSSLQNWEGPDGAFVDVQMDIQEALVELGESMVHNHTVPDEEESPTSSQTLGTNHHSYAVPLATGSNYTSPRSSSRHLRHRRSPIRSQIIGPSVQRAPSPAHRDTVTYQDLGQELSGSELEASDPVVDQELPGEKPNSEAGERPSAKKVEDHSESPLSTPEINGDFISVRRTSSDVYFNPNIAHKTISGYVSTRAGPVQVRALLDNELSENIISLTLVTQLGLRLYDTDEEKDFLWVHIGNGARTKSRGRVVLNWSQGAFSSHTPFKAHCWVYEDNETEGLVFGKPFLRKRTHYSQPTENGEGSSKER